MTQFVACKFSESQARTYTYANSGDPLKPGDRVLVDVRGKEKTVIVSEVVEEPHFDCKPIKGLAPAKEEDATEAVG